MLMYLRTHCKTKGVGYSFGCNSARYTLIDSFAGSGSADIHEPSTSF